MVAIDQRECIEELIWIGLFEQRKKGRMREIPVDLRCSITLNEGLYSVGMADWTHVQSRNALCFALGVSRCIYASFCFRLFSNPRTIC